MSRSKAGHFGPYFILIAAVLWALDSLLRKYLGYALPSVTIVLIEHLIGFVLLLPFVIKGVFKTKPTFSVLGLGALVGLLSGLLGTLLFTEAFTVGSFSVIFLLQKLQPIFAAAAAVIFLREKLGKQYVLWAIIALASGYFITFPSGMVDLSGDAVKAGLLAGGAAFFWGTSTVFSKMLLERTTFQAAAFYRFAFTILFALAAMPFLNALGSFAAVGLNHLAVLLVIALSTGMVALLFYYKGLQKTQAKISTLLELAFPALGVFLDYMTGGGMLMPVQWYAAAMLLISFYHISKLNYVDEIH